MKHIQGFIASDHRGFELKECIKKKFPLIDVGPFEYKPKDDYPIYAKKLSKLVVKEKSTGILLCGSGVGMEIAANRTKGIRAALCSTMAQAKSAREEDDANVLVLSADTLELALAQKIIKTFFETKFRALPRYKRRIKEIDK